MNTNNCKVVLSHDAVKIIDCNKIKNPSSMGNTCDGKEKEISEVKDHITHTQGSFNTNFKYDPVSDMERSISDDMVILQRKIDKVARTKKDIEDCRASLKKKSKFFDDTKKKFLEFPALKSGPLYRKLAENMLLDIEESVSDERKFLKFKIKELASEKECVEFYKNLLTKEKERLSDLKRKIQNLRERHASVLRMDDI